MKVLTFGIDNRALLEKDGHSKRWNSRMGNYVDQLDVIVEVRGKTHYSDKWISDNVRIIPINVPHPALYSLIAYKKALEEYKKVKYDLVTTEEPFRTGFAAWLFKQKTGVAVSMEYHNDTFYNEGWINERPVSHRIYIAAGKIALKAADSVRCVSLKNYHELKKLSKDDPSKIIEIIPVPTEFYRDGEHGHEANEIRRHIVKGEHGVIVLYVGRLVNIKKVNELIEAFGEISNKYNDTYLVIVGDGPEYNTLNKLAKKNGDGKIIFKGYVPEEEVFSYYGASDIFVNPAHIEPYGRIYIEAMSARKPIVTTSGAGAVDDKLCLNNVNALVVQPGNRSELTQAIMKLIEDEGLRTDLGERGLEIVKQKFNYNDSLTKMEQFWKRTIEHSKRSN